MQLKKLLWISALSVALALVSAFVVSCSSDDGGDDGGGQAEWTVMLYGAGNNDLDQANNGTSYIVQDVQDMEKVGSQDGINMIAMVSRYGGGGNAKYYKVGYYPNENPNALSSEELLNLGTKDMSDPATLKAFINYCKQNFPANRYQLIIDDHGAGWPGSCSDDLAGAGGLLTMPECREAIATSDLGRVDILTWHACLMSMAEVAYELRSVCEYMTSCQFTMPMENILGADLWLGWLKDNKTASNENYARKVVESVIQRAQFKQKTTHYAMIKMSEMQNLGAALGTFGNILVQEGGQHWGEVLNAWNSTHATDLDNPTYVDIREFTNQIQAQPTLSTINLIVSNCNNVRNAINAAVPFTDTYFHSPTQPVPRGGLNVYIPWQVNQYVPDSVSYSSLAWRATNWHSFISTFVRSLGGGGDPTGRCCYNNNTQCAEVTQAECNTVAGTWTQGASCNDGCGGGAPTGRCCYNNNTQCADNATQAECNSVAGIWTQGATCAQGCGGGGGQCAATCAQAQNYTPGTIVDNCTLSGPNAQNWFSTTLGTGVWRFQLVAAQGGADFDIYTFATDCATALGCQGVAQGDEDFTCTVEGGSIAVRVLVVSYEGSGGYQFAISQVGVSDPDGMTLAVK